MGKNKIRRVIRVIRNKGLGSYLRSTAKILILILLVAYWFQCCFRGKLVWKEQSVYAMLTSD